MGLVVTAPARAVIMSGPARIRAGDLGTSPPRYRPSRRPWVSFATALSGWVGATFQSGRSSGSRAISAPKYLVGVVDTTRPHISRGPGERPLFGGGVRELPRLCGEHAPRAAHGPYPAPAARDPL